jgi:hypothetical protein
VPFKNFSIWRGRLPHWRADDVTYYVTFRHRRPLEPAERAQMLNALLRPEGRKWNLLILCVLPEATELIFTVNERREGEAFELSDIVEPAKRRVGKWVIKKTGERLPPFYEESFDRIVRDEVELQERFDAILESPVKAEMAAEPDEYDELWVSGA